jgi:pyruvate-formate lyase-activating enzyme
MDHTKLIRGAIFDLQGFSVHDGPGCRTLIFLKGCSLHCEWCSNPEGIAHFPEPLWNSEKCSSDLACVDACPHQSVSTEKNQLYFDKTKCFSCLTHDCLKACHYGALRLAGYFMTVDEIFRQIARDRQYWGPGGGITLTGGEPFLQPQFSYELLKRCYDSFIHTAAETCGNVPWENIGGTLPYLDWIFFDLKHMNPEKHHQATKLKSVHSSAEAINPATLPSTNPQTVHQRILSNARNLAREFKGRLVFRMPLIPGFNDDIGNISQTATFMQEIGIGEINLLPVHHLGREKYNLLGQTYYTTNFTIPTGCELNQIREQFAAFGILCYIGSETPF